MDTGHSFKGQMPWELTAAWIQIWQWRERRSIQDQLEVELARFGKLEAEDERKKSRFVLQFLA